MATAGLVEQARALFGPKMAAVERALVAHLDDCPASLAAPARSVLASGGKRLRPILHLLTADLFHYRGDADVVVATALEYVHVASLLHDDVIDEADLRRGRPSMNRQLGNTLSVLLGDHLCVKALTLASSAGTPEVHALVCRATLELVEGEAMQEAQAGRLDLSPEEYLQTVQLKTAKLMAAACETAAVLAGAPASERARMREYGTHLGMAFQIADDILDFASDRGTLGKPVLSDLSRGHLTLPVLAALASGGAHARDVVGAVLAARDSGGAPVEGLVALLRETGALDAAGAAARSLADRARGCLVGLPDSLAVEALRVAADYAINRTS